MCEDLQQQKNQIPHLSPCHQPLSTLVIAKVIYLNSKSYSAKELCLFPITLYKIRTNPLNIAYIEALHSLGPLSISSRTPCHICLVPYLQHHYFLDWSCLIIPPYLCTYAASLLYHQVSHSSKPCLSVASFIEASFSLFPRRDKGSLLSVLLVP